jgi:hypothetical protein
MEEKPINLTEQEILSLLEELKQEAKADDVIREKGLVIEALSSNRPVSRVLNDMNFIHDIEDPKTSIQLLNNLILTWSSLITKDRPSVYGVAVNNDLNSLSAAEITTKLIEYIETEESVSDKWHQTALHAASHGTGLMKIVFNPGTNRIEWQPLSIFDCFLQNKSDFDSVQWCVVRSYIDKWDAKELIEKAGASIAGTPETSTYKDGAGIDRQGVEKWEIWYKPGARYKNGLYACVIAGTVVEAMDYPYIFTEVDGNTQKALLPVVIWTCRKTRGATLGTSWTTDCAPIQANINNLYSKVTDDALRAKQVLLLPASLKNVDIEDDGRLYVDQASYPQVGMIKWVSPAPLDQNVQQALQRDVESIYVSAGISQSTSGDASASQSGKALAYQAQLDSEKHADSFKSFQRCLRSAWELSLKLIQKYYTVPQTINIAGEEAISFRGSDLAGVTVRLESRQEKDSSRSSKQEALKQDVAAGFADPAKLSEHSPISASMKIVANDLIDKFIAGEDISLTPESIVPELLISVLDERIKSALLMKDVALVELLKAFKQDYLRMLSSIQSPDPDTGNQTASTAPASSPNPLPTEDISTETIQ